MNFGEYLSEMNLCEAIDKHEKWRRVYNGKIFYKTVFKIEDPMGNKKRVVFHYRYNDTMDGDKVTILDPSLIGKWEGGGTPFSIRNLQAKGSAFEKMPKDIIWKDEEEFNKVITNLIGSGKKFVDVAQKKAGLRVPLSHFMRRWIDTGIGSIDSVEFDKVKQ